MQKLEGLHNDTALDLNIGYYTMKISPESLQLTTIITYFGKFRYNRVPMGLCASGDTFQYKVEKLLGDTEGVKRYIGYIIVLSKGKFSQHIDHIRVIFARLRTAGLQVNSPK